MIAKLLSVALVFSALSVILFSTEYVVAVSIEDFTPQLHTLFGNGVSESIPNDCWNYSDDLKCEFQNSVGGPLESLFYWNDLPGESSEWSVVFECSVDTGAAYLLVRSDPGYITYVCDNLSDTVYSGHVISDEEWDSWDDLPTRWWYGPGDIEIDVVVDAGPPLVTVYVDFLVLRRTYQTPIPPPANPLTDTTIALLLLILWIAFVAIGAIIPSSVFMILASFSGIVLGVFYILPNDEVAGIASLGAALVCLVIGIGMAQEGAL